MRKKSNNNFVQEQPKQGWAYFEESNQWRRTPDSWGAPGNHFPKKYGDWVAVSKPQGWRPPHGTLAGESLLDGGGARLNAAPGAGGGADGSGSGTKIGAGHKPQPYGWHGYYGETDGGSSTSPVHRGKVTPPYEVRGKVTPPAQKGTVVPPPPAPLDKGGRVGVSTKNDVPGKQGPDPEALNPETREQVQSVLDKSPSVEDVNMNSGYRSGDPTAHGEGQAADINRINGQKVSDAVNPAVPADQREVMRERLEEIRAAARANKEVEAYIDPLDGFFRPKDPNSKDEGRKANDKDKYEHRHHIHITIRK